MCVCVWGGGGGGGGGGGAGFNKPISNAYYQCSLTDGLVETCSPLLLSP